jgi:hypothetical protein
MASKQIHIFATRKDLEPGILKIEEKYPLKYTLCGLFLSEKAQLWNSLIKTEDLGYTTKKIQSCCKEYLVLRAETDLKIGNVPQHAGGIRYEIDQLLNQKSITIRPGGIYDSGILMCGRIATASDDPDSVKLYREFCRAITKGFWKHRGYNVGPEALQLAKAGVRLITMHIDEDRKYDLKPE